MTDKYILDNAGNPVPEPDLMRWTLWFQKSDRHVAQDVVGDALVSTVFLGIDRRHFGGGAPLLFETMIFGGPHDQWHDRYDTREAALEGHKRAVFMASEGLH